ncbi:MAG TPA: metalloregulator ArsR/SmtB family transcription factor [bacterium]|nr:metalloregulator ArsR/SmtB family transcription factor [bacterium]
MQDLSDSLRFLGDSTRLRILRCLGVAPLNVGELVQILGAAQSNVSHHLSKLKKAGLVSEERQGSTKFFSLVRSPLSAAGPDGAVEGEAGQLWPLVRLAVEWQDDDDGDLSRLRDLLREREDRQALNERLLEPGQSWFLWGRALGSLLPPLDAADFGCGSGILSIELARWARSVVAIDSNAQVLAKARARAEGAGDGLARRIKFQRDDLQALSLKAATLDLVVISQSLHHVEHPEKVVREAARVLRPGGQLVLIELLPHRQEWVTQRLGHRHLGFEPDVVRGWIKAAGFSVLSVDDSLSRGSDAFRPFLVTARVPEE